MSLFVLLFGCAVLVVGMQDFFIRYTEIDKDFLMPVLPDIKKIQILQAEWYLVTGSPELIFSRPDL